MIELFKILHGFYDNNSDITLTPHVGVAVQEATNINCIKVLLNMILKNTFFTNRVVSPWNSLPDEVVDPNTINCFKGRLDQFWDNQSVKYNWDADFTGTGNRSLCYQESLLE